MRFLKWVAGILVLLIVVFFAGAFLLPREAVVERTVAINAAPDAIFPYVNSLKATQEWSPWLARDPEVKLDYSGPETGVGAKMAWDSDNPQVGVGSQEILASQPGARVDTALDFGEMGTAKAAFILDAAGDTTNVTWTLVSDAGSNPTARWMGLFLDSLVGGDYETGLSNLKTLVEGG